MPACCWINRLSISTMLFACILSARATPTLRIINQPILPDEDTIVEVRLENPQHVLGVQLYLLYDARLGRVVPPQDEGTEAQDGVLTGLATVNYETDGPPQGGLKEVAFAIATSPEERGASSSGTLIRLRFHAVASLPPMATTGLFPRPERDGDRRNIIATPNAVYVRFWTAVERPFTPQAPGDANGDGKADLTDVSFLMHALLTPSFSEGLPQEIDANGNGFLDLADIRVLLRHVVGLA